MKAKILFTGDIVNTKQNNSFISNELSQIISEQDFAVCNFEAPIEGYGEKILKVGPHLNQKKETIKILKQAGFNLLLLANNHLFDYGKEGLKATLMIANENDVESVGAGIDIATIYQAFFKEINGLKIGIINASEAQFGVIDDISGDQKSGYAWINHHLIDEEIIKTKARVDFLIFCAHAGLENFPVPLEEWRKRYKRLCDLGVDCIIGTHPHVPQGYEVYNNKPIFYSLGNFYFDTASFANSPDYSYSVILFLTKNDLISFELIYHYKENGLVKLLNKDNATFDINDLNQKLDDKDLLNKIYLSAYHSITKNYFSLVFNTILSSDSFVQVLKKIALKFVFSKRRKRNKELLLLHLLKNETYRWVTQRGVLLNIRK